MIKSLLVLALCFLTGASWSQNILFVDDNDNITDNTDSVLVALQLTTYGTFDYYNIADSAGATPGSALLEQYDLVIWYASTDGVGLGFWTTGTGGDSELITYLVDGGRLWVIGSDLLYAGGYTTLPATFAAGDFTHDFMGLASYDVQSYGDDGNVGVSEVDRMTGAPAYFPGSLSWIFPTHWWVDGVTPLAGATNLYEMGPSSYTLAGAIPMTHYRDANTNTMSTFFDPALIDTRVHRVNFLQQSIFYLLNFDLGISETASPKWTVYPNPATNEVVFSAEAAMNNSCFELVSATGTVVRTGALSGTAATIELTGLCSGIYFLHSGGSVQQLVKE